MSVGASSASGQYQSCSRLRCRQCGRKSCSAATTRLIVPQREGSPENFPDEFPEIRLEAEWPPPPRYAEVEDRCPRGIVRAESIAWQWPLLRCVPLFWRLVAADDPFAVTFGNIDPCLGITIEFPSSAAGT